MRHVALFGHCIRSRNVISAHEHDFLEQRSLRQIPETSLFPLISSPYPKTVPSIKRSYHISYKYNRPNTHPQMNYKNLPHAKKARKQKVIRLPTDRIVSPALMLEIIKMPPYLPDAIALLRDDLQQSPERRVYELKFVQNEEKERGTSMPF